VLNAGWRWKRWKRRSNAPDELFNETLHSLNGEEHL
jgi:hypothetical protein